MRELTVRIRFVKHCLGGVKHRQEGGRWMFLRNPATGSVMFLASWHQSNLRFASQLLGRHQNLVTKILWDVNVDGVVERNGWFHRYYEAGGRKQRKYVVHEAFLPGQVIGLNCVVPTAITDDDLWQLLRIAGQYKGISPGRPGEYGQYEVVSIRPRRAVREVTEPEVLPTPPAPA